MTDVQAQAMLTQLIGDGYGFARAIEIIVSMARRERQCAG